MAEVAGEIRVIDGDTFEVAGTRVRLHGIDAPERGQTCTTEQGVAWACGAWVTSRVHARFDGTLAECLPLDRDRYDRVVATCQVGGVDVGGWIVAEGYGFAYRRYSMSYDLVEKQAAAADRGLWAMNVTRPAWFRATRAEGRLPPDRACRIKGNVSSKGVRTYHLPGQAHYERTGIRIERGERWFCSEAEALGAGWRKARR
ncbi:thermonuclease family protein [Pseudaestuariivita sp.]|uniref:thermonuclease family protein n=1 Tax=Pseudaestuariivita sp. TaxID=2211669 RepID=UPI004058D9A5